MMRLDRNDGRHERRELTSFTHVFFSEEGAAPGVTELRAKCVLGSLRAARATRAAMRGDRFPDAYDFALTPLEGVRRIFGGSELADGLRTAPVGEWAGPFRSDLGLHLIRISERELAQPTVLELERARVRLHEEQASACPCRDAA